MERGIRAAKRECMMLQEVGDTEGLQKASLRLRNQREKYRAYCKETGLKQHNDRTQVYGYDRSKSSKTVWAERKAKSGLDNGSRSGIMNMTTNANGTPVKIVERTDLTGEPNSITQRENTKGGIDRNYYDGNGKQTKQVSNHDHGNPKNHPFGKNGEHAHDYSYDENGDVTRSEARNLTDEERMENGDIL